jgi:4-hydroxybenzoate polyprenyltransferase
VSTSPPAVVQLVEVPARWRRWQAYAQLVRLPNVFTAMADIFLAGFATGSVTGRPFAFVVVLLASCCLYCAGLVWNDFFDLEEDRRDRFFRPLPSGRVSLAAAVTLGVVLTGAGLLFAALASFLDGAFRPLTLIMAGWLVVAILMYDGWLKRIWAGPLGMGACRFLNVLLGLSASGVPLDGWWVFLASVVGVYIVGVTWFARTEATRSKVPHLVGAAGVMLAALFLGLAVPIVALEQPEATTFLFPYLLVGFGFYLGVPIRKAIKRPEPRVVQAAVKRSVLGLIFLDAILASSLAGIAGLLIALLFLPARFLGRWIYST